MGLLDLRELLQFPAGDNATDVLINNVHFNRTALEFFEYSWYDNGTISNRSACYLIFENFKPVMFSNGTFVNATSCYDPFYRIRARGSLGIVFAVLFGATIVSSLVNLRKLGRRFLPAEKRFRAVGRRWQWYWLIFVGANGVISGFMGIDVDRAYMQSLPIILQNFFYFMMTAGIMAAVWEGVRHWGSWQERQICDREPFSLRQDDKRSKREFFMPLIFYLFAFLNFFMVIPRSWTKIQFQRSIEQANKQARPAATDGRFKAGAIFLFLAWTVIVYCLRHNLHYYKPRSHGPVSSTTNFVRLAPTRFLIVLLICLVTIGYNLAIAFDFDISPLKSSVEPGWMYGLGYAPVFLISLVLQVYGWLAKNEDRILINARRDRDRRNDADLGIQKKPSWWHHRREDDVGPGASAQDRLKALTKEIGGGRATSKNIERALEMGHMPARPRPPPEDSEDQNPFSDNPERPTPSPQTPTTTVGATVDRTPRTEQQQQRPSGADRKPSDVSSAPSATSQMQPMRVRSMLDV
ncbi:MAG: hypothetical protein M1833_002385 [Piccolia ochrophora]|nr:MAG: hypothetical protein M1833_002385 [Piccolia ochrophora]